MRLLALKPPVLFALLALALAGLVVFSSMRRAPAPASFGVPAQAAETMAALPTQVEPAPPTAAPTVLPADSAPVPDLPFNANAMRLPADYRDTFALYATVERSDSITRRIYISPNAVDALRAGSRTLPEGTQVIVEAYTAARDAAGHLLRDEAGHLIPGELKPEIHIAELRSTWQPEDFAAPSHLGNLNFASFEASGARTSEVLSECFSCHDAAHSRGLLFTSAELLGYAASGETQYSTCNLPGRVPC